jgi:hypothetical protein
MEEPMKFQFKTRESQAMMESGARMLRKPIFWMLGLSLALAPCAKAGLIGYYSLDNWTLTNTDLGGGLCTVMVNGSPVPVTCTDGSAASPDGGLSVVLTGGNHGTGTPGTTDLVILAMWPGLVQFQYSYLSDDTIPGCGGPCDRAGYLLNGSFHLLADDVNQLTGNIAFDVTAGDLFGLRVETMDNTGGPGILTVTDFSAPVPEPRTTSLVFMAFAAMIAAGVRARRALLR